MAYEIEEGQTRAVVDESAAPLTTANATCEGFGSDATAAKIIDDGAGTFLCVGNHVGTTTFGFTRAGVTKEHIVTVVASTAGFDWTLGDPV